MTTQHAGQAGSGEQATIAADFLEEYGSVLARGDDATRDALTLAERLLRSHASLSAELADLQQQRRNWLDTDITARTLVTQEQEITRLSAENATLRDALEIVRPHVDFGQARLNGSYCAAKIDEHTFCGRGREWPGHRADVKEWPEHEFVDGGALVAALSPDRKGP